MTDEEKQAGKVIDLEIQDMTIESKETIVTDEKKEEVEND